MEALDFLKELFRMCNKSASGCPECPLYSTTKKYYLTCRELMEQHPEETIRVVEQWSKEHPRVTNKMKICEVFGDEAIYAISSPNVQALKDWLDEPYTVEEYKKHKERTPAADVRPVVRGKWEDCTEYNGEYRCSVCKEFEGHKRNFCPNCGADMREANDGI